MIGETTRTKNELIDDSDTNTKHCRNNTISQADSNIDSDATSNNLIFDQSNTNLSVPDEVDVGSAAVVNNSTLLNSDGSKTESCDPAEVVCNIKYEMAKEVFDSVLL